MKLLDGNYLFDTPMVTPSGFFAALTIGFGLLLLLSLFAYFQRAKLAPKNPVLRRFIRRMATTGMWYAGVGLFLALLRYAQIPYLGMRIWMYVLFLSMIASVAYFVYDLSERYPLALVRLHESHAERRYKPISRPRSEPQRAKPKPTVRGKRKR